MGRSPCCSRVGLNRGAWTAAEDELLSDFIKLHGEGSWRKVPIRAGLKRCGKSCRLRWLNYLKPDIKRGNITYDEEELIVRLHKLLGNRWSLIARRLPGRTDNEIKNYWNTILAKRVRDDHGKTLNKKVPNDKRKKTEAPELEREREPPHKTIPVETPVVRTKASRCSKAFMNSVQSQKRTITSDDYFNDQKEQEKPPFHEYSSISNTNVFSSDGCDLLSPFTPGAQNPSNFMLHYTVEELQFLDLLNLESSGCCVFSYLNYSNMINLDHSPPSDSPLL